jgi:hypothetical protein
MIAPDAGRSSAPGDNKGGVSVVIAQATLQSAVSLVLYEMQMLLGCAHTPPLMDRFFKNLQAEGLPLHARVLRDFFFTKVKQHGKRITRPDDIVAVDYFTITSAWPYTSAHLPPYLHANKERMDRALAHLSYDRLKYTGAGKRWLSAPLLQELGEKWFEFLHRLQERGEPAATWFTQQAPEYDVPLTPPL